MAESLNVSTFASLESTLISSQRTPGSKRRRNASDVWEIPKKKPNFSYSFQCNFLYIFSSFNCKENQTNSNL